VIFAGGEVSLPDELLSSGMSGPSRITPPEQPVPLSRMNGAALMRLYDELGALVKLEIEADGGAMSELTEYMLLLVKQAGGELARRANGL
jgi:hypothetical protein